MESLAKSDIFFFITTAAVIILTILIAIALVYIIKIMHEARKLMTEVKRQGEVLIDDIEDARAYIKREGLKVGAVVSLVTGLFRHKSKSRAIRGSSKETSDSEE